MCTPGLLILAVLAVLVPPRKCDEVVHEGIAHHLQREKQKARRPRSQLDATERRRIPARSGSLWPVLQASGPDKLALFWWRLQGCYFRMKLKMP